METPAKLIASPRDRRSFLKTGFAATGATRRDRLACACNRGVCAGRPVSLQVMQRCCSSWRLERPRG